MKRLLVLLCLCGPVWGAEVTLSWTNATHNTDASVTLPLGSPIPLTGPGSLVSTTIKWGACNPDDTPAPPLSNKVVPTTVPGASESTLINIFTPGRWCFLGFHTNMEAVRSADSNPAWKQIIMVPNPPTPTVTEIIAYSIVKVAGRLVLLPVGTVPMTAPCDPDNSVNGHYAVPVDQVTWSGTVRPLVVVAKCGG